MPYSLLNIPDFAFPSLPSHYQLHGRNWIAFFLDQVIPWSTEHQCQPQTGFWQPVSMPVLINRGQTLSECEVCSSCWASPLLPALSLPYSLPPLCFSFGGDFALPHHIFQAVWRCFLCTLIFSITQWCCILVLDDATFLSSLNGHRTDSILWISISMRKDSCCCVNSFFSFATIYPPLKVSASPWCTYSSGSHVAFFIIIIPFF